MFACIKCTVCCPFLSRSTYYYGKKCQYIIFVMDAIVNKQFQLALIMASSHVARDRMFPLALHAIIAPVLPWQCESISMADWSEFRTKRNARSWQTITINALVELFASWISTFATWFTGLYPKMSNWGPKAHTPHSSPANETASSIVTFTPSWSNRSSWIWFPLIMASLKAARHGSGRMFPFGQGIFLLKQSLPMFKAMKTQALLPVLPWMSDCDSA